MKFLLFLLLIEIIIMKNINVHICGQKRGKINIQMKILSYLNVYKVITDTHFAYFGGIVAL